MNKNFVETSEDCFKNIGDFPYKANYMKGNLGLPKEYDNFKISYIDENNNGKEEHYFLFMVIQLGVIYGDI